MVWGSFGHVNFFLQNPDGWLERGDKILKNGICLFPTCQKLTEILQVYFIFKPFLPEMCGREG